MSNIKNQTKKVKDMGKELRESLPHPLEERPTFILREPLIKSLRKKKDET